MSTSTVGENQRRSQSPSSRRTRNAVSERFISRATACIHSPSGYASSTHTAAGLPANAVSVKASTVTILVKSVGAGDHGDEVVLIGGEGNAAVGPPQTAHADALLVQAVFELAAVVPLETGEPGAGGFDGFIHARGVDGALLLALLRLLKKRFLHVVEHLRDARGEAIERCRLLLTLVAAQHHRRAA